MQKKPSLLIRILIPVLIVVAVAGLWLFKNADSLKKHTSDAEQTATDNTIPGADFSLESTAMIDYEAIASFGLPMIVDYGSDSCIPCKEMAPVLEKLNAELAGKAFIKFVDVWKYADAASNVPVQVIPTQVLVNADGTPFVPSEELMQTVGNFIMYNSRDTEEHVFTVHQGGLTEEQMRLILAEMGVQ